MATVAQAESREDGVAIARRIARGDNVAARGLIEAYGNPLLRFVLRRSHGSIEDAEEIVQDTFVTAVKLSGSFEGNSSLFTWLCCIAKFKLRDHFRGQLAVKRTADRNQVRLDDRSLDLVRQIHDPGVSIEEIVDRIDRMQLVQCLLDSMTDEQREAVTLRYVEGFSVAETALIMNKSSKAVERLLERAKEGPRQAMFRWFSDESFRALCWDVLLI